MAMESDMLTQSDLHVDLPASLLLEAAATFCDDFDLVSIDLEDSEDFELTSREASARFGPKMTAGSLDKLVTSRVPTNTRRNTAWGVSVYNAVLTSSSFKKGLDIARSRHSDAASKQPKTSR